MRHRLGQVRLWAEVIALLPVVELGIRRLPMPRLCRLLRVRLDLTSPLAPVRQAPLPWWTRPIYDVVERALGRWPWEATCLRRSLLLAVLLRRLSPALRVGVRTGAERFTAHAWLEVDGESLEDQVDDLLLLEAT